MSLLHEEALIDWHTGHLRHYLWTVNLDAFVQFCTYAAVLLLFLFKLSYMIQNQLQYKHGYQEIIQ